jgi:hypothetical protein
MYLILATLKVIPFNKVIVLFHSASHPICREVLVPSKKSSSGFSAVRPHAAGMDIGVTFHIVAVSLDCDPTPVRQFQSSTTDLRRLSHRLREAGVTSVAMESTGAIGSLFSKSLNRMDLR